MFSPVLTVFPLVLVLYCHSFSLCGSGIEELKTVCGAVAAELPHGAKVVFNFLPERHHCLPGLRPHCYRDRNIVNTGLITDKMTVCNICERVAVKGIEYYIVII